MTVNVCVYVHGCVRAHVHDIVCDDLPFSVKGFPTMQSRV